MPRNNENDNYLCLRLKLVELVYLAPAGEQAQPAHHAGTTGVNIVAGVTLSTFPGHRAQVHQGKQVYLVHMVKQFTGFTGPTDQK